MDTRDDHEFAWRVHDAQELWIGKVDVKASVVLAFEAAVAVLAVTNDDLRSVIHGSDLWNRLLGIGGIALLLAAVVCVGAAVWPVTGRDSRAPGRVGPAPDLLWTCTAYVGS